MKMRVVAAVVCALALASAASANLLTNPGFETGDFTGWTEGGWYTGMGGDAYSGSYGGSYAISPTIIGENYFVAEQNVPVTAGLSYDLSGWMRIAGTPTTSESFLELRWLDSIGDPLGQVGSTHLSSAQDYSQFSILEQIAPPSAVGARIALVVHTSATPTDNAWHTFDDINFAQTIPEPTTLALAGMAIAVLTVLRKRPSR